MAAKFIPCVAAAVIALTHSASAQYYYHGYPPIVPCCGPIPTPAPGPTLNQYYQNYLSTLPRNPPPVQVMPPNAFGSTIR